MAVLTDTERRDVWKRFMDAMGNRDRTLAFSKNELRTAINEMDDWVDANFLSAIGSITGTPSTGLTQDEQIELFHRVVLRRYERIGVT